MGTPGQVKVCISGVWGCMISPIVNLLATLTTVLATLASASLVHGQSGDQSGDQHADCRWGRLKQDNNRLHVSSIYCRNTNTSSLRASVNLVLQEL